MPLNARQKGKRGEREFRDVLRAAGYCARRGQQYSGEIGNPDVVCGDLPVHWEVKRCQNTSVHKWLQQAKDDSRQGEFPIVAHKRNGETWKASLEMDDLLEIIRRSDLPAIGKSDL